MSAPVAQQAANHNASSFVPSWRPQRVRVVEAAEGLHKNSPYIADRYQAPASISELNPKPQDMMLACSRMLLTILKETI